MRFALLLAVVGATAGAALAAGGERQQISFNAADQAAAGRAVARRSDFGQGAWAGGATKPDLSPEPTCANYHPKQHDLVLTGAASSKWSDNGLEIDTQAQILRSKEMVAADWRRTVLAPAAIPCLRTHLVKSLGKGVTYVGFRRVLFAPVATNSRAYVLLVDVKTTTGKVRVALEIVLVARGRTEIAIISTAPNVAQKIVAQADTRLAQALVSRAT